MSMEKDCKVCQQLIKEKNRNMIWWKVFCLIFATLSLVLGILYFSSGSLTKETNIEINSSFNDSNSSNGNIIIGGDNNTTDSDFYGIITEKDYTPIICIAVVACVSLLVCGGVLIANYTKRND